MNQKNMKHTPLIRLLIAFCLFAMACSGFATERPNILMIAIDDLNTSIGANRDLDNNFFNTIYPEKALRDAVAKRLTPNLDKFAGEGRQFVNAMCQAPLCGPSRTALMTGVPAHVSGFYDHSKHFRAYRTLQDAVTLPQYLKTNGYHTAGLGKIFHKPNVETLTPEGDWPDTLYSWNEWISAAGGTGSSKQGLHAYSPQRAGSAGNMTWGYSDPKEETRDWLNARFARSLLENGTATHFDLFKKTDASITLPQDKPFFLACGIFRPHLPFFAPREYYDLFPISEMSIDRELFDKVVADLDDLPPAGRSWTQLTSGKFHAVISRGEKLAGKEGQILAWKYCIQAYLACIAYADECVGEILTGLDNSQFRDNTTVIIWSDHGYFLGNKARIAKQCLWRESLNCNLIVRTPGMKAPGQPSDQLVQLTDLYATVTALCGLEKPENIMGMDIGPVIADPAAQLERQYVYSTYGEGNHAIYSNDYKLICYQNGDMEFYDLRNDPGEYTNLANLEPMQGTVAKWQQRLKDSLETARKVAARAR